MKRKTLVYVGVGLLILLIAVSLFGRPGNMNGENIKKVESDIDLSKYRSEDIPEECRLSEYDDNIDWWKQHLSHHENTLHCLDYYK